MSQNDPRVLADFIGNWRLSRQISHADGTQATFEGRAAWVPSGTGAAYEETGTLRIAGQQAPMTGTRRYGWNAALDVTFEDGRFFHTVPRAGGETRHWCDPDAYRVVYDFSKWPAFTTTWSVQGPRKDYTMVSVYRRECVSSGDAET